MAVDFKDASFSLEVCSRCAAVGAEYSSPHGDLFFCHEDCARIYNRLDTKASLIGAELFDQPHLLVGYAIEDGRAGVCANCLTNDIALSTRLLGSDIGVCSQQCANDLSSSMRVAGIEASMVGSFLRRRFKNATYEQGHVLACAAYLWLKARSSGGDLPGDPEKLSEMYREPMLQVFHVLGTSGVVQGQDAPYFDSRFWDAFARFCRCAADRAAAGATDPVASPAYRDANADAVRDGVRAYMQKLSFDFDDRKVADTLWRMFVLYWRRYLRLHRAGGNDDISRHQNEPAVVGRKDGDCDTRGRNQMTLQSDISEVYVKLVRVHMLPTAEALAVLKYGLFRDITPELETLKEGREAEVYDNPSLRYVGAELLDAQNTQQINGIFDSLKRRYRSGKDTLNFGKKYSASTVTRLLYNAWLIQNCMPREERLARKLDWGRDIQPSVAAGVFANAIAALKTAGFRQEEDTAAKKLLEFSRWAKEVAMQKNKRSTEKGGRREGKDRSQENFAALCGLKGEYGKRGGVRFDTIAQELVQEISAMALYYATGKAADRASESGLSDHQKTLQRDIEGIFEDLRYRMGREASYQYVYYILEVSERSISDAVPDPAAGAAAAAAATATSTPPASFAGNPSSALPPRSATVDA